MKKVFILLIIAAIVNGCFAACSSRGAVELVELSEDGVSADDVALAGSNENPDFDEPMSSMQEPVNDSVDEPSVKDEAEDICVYVCGAVNTPGVYTLAKGSRVYEAIMSADGFRIDADEEYVNQAEVLADGVKLLIPTKDETEKIAEVNRSDPNPNYGIIYAESVQGTGVSASAAATNEVGSSSRLVNINTASAAELESLNGIGTTRAQAIIGYRDANGGFSSIEDVMKVSGIKNALFEKIKDHITVQ